MISPLTPLEFLARSASAYHDCTAVVDHHQRHTYAEMRDRVHSFAAALQNAGIAPGDRVAVLARNGVLPLEAHFAVPLIGGVLVMLNVRLKAGELATILNHSGATILLGDADLIAPFVAVREAVPQVKRFVTDYAAFVLECSRPPVPHPPAEDDVISINYTSGTTGLPKGVMYTHRGAYLNAIGEIIEHGLSFRSVYLWTLPMFHCNGWCYPWAVTAVGARHICLPEVNAERALKLIEEESVTHLCGAPIVVRTLTEYCAKRKVRLPGLKMMVAAAPPPPAVIRAAEEIGIELTHVYGLTETYGPHSVCAWHTGWDILPEEKRAQLKARQGVPYTVFGTDMRVVDENMQDVPSDAKTVGEVVMRGNNVMLGYYDDPAGTETAFAGGWFHSGDLAVMHPDGYVELRDRAKDIIISGGENISTIEVERVLYDHPDVLEAAVVGQPDEKWGEVPHAYVLLRDGAKVSENGLIEFCREQLAHFKCPKAIHFGPLPKTSTGKIRKSVLRQQAQAVAQGA